jgi:hypothetical protein
VERENFTFFISFLSHLFHFLFFFLFYTFLLLFVMHHLFSFCFSYPFFFICMFLRYSGLSTCMLWDHKSQKVLFLCEFISPLHDSWYCFLLSSVCVWTWKNSQIAELIFIRFWFGEFS